MKKILFSICTLFLAFVVDAKVIYVSPEGSDSNNGSSWSTALRNFGTAYEKASAQDQIWMAGGTYYITATVMMKDEVDVYGGLKIGATSTDDRERPNAVGEPWSFTNATVITANAPLGFRPVDSSNKATYWKGVVLDGLEFRDIEAQDGRVLYLADGVTLQNSAVINCGSLGTNVYFERNGGAKNCLFESNYTSGTGSVTMQLRGSHDNEIGLFVTDCIFRNNKVESLSIYNTHGANKIPGEGHIIKGCKFVNNKTKCIQISEQGNRDTQIVDCVFEGNVATDAKNTGSIFGGSINSGLSPNSKIYLVNSVIRNNENKDASDWKNGILYLPQGVRVMNCLIANNTSAQSLIYCVGDIHNSTIVNNVGAIATTMFGTFINNIMAFNGAQENDVIISLDSESYCYLINNALNYTSNIKNNGDNSEIYGEISTDMSTFKNPTSFVGLATDDGQLQELSDADFSLSEGSNCIYGGDADEIAAYQGNATYTALMEKDLAGNDRFTNGKINIGAYQGSLNVGISSANSSSNVLVFTGTGGITVKVAEKSLVEVYSITGVKVSATYLIDEGFISLNSGAYLVKVDTQVYKVLVR